jgi:hypothetical protein
VRRYNIKTVGIEAGKKGIQRITYAKHIVSESDEDKFIQTLSFEN